MHLQSLKNPAIDVSRRIMVLQLHRDPKEITLSLLNTTKVV